MQNPCGLPSYTYMNTPPHSPPHLHTHVYAHIHHPNAQPPTHHPCMPNPNHQHSYSKSELMDSQCKTAAGTLEYVAPETLLNKCTYDGKAVGMCVVGTGGGGGGVMWGVLVVVCVWQKRVMCNRDMLHTHALLVHTHTSDLYTLPTCTHTTHTHLHTHTLTHTHIHSLTHTHIYTHSRTHRRMELWYCVVCHAPG